MSYQNSTGAVIPAQSFQLGRLEIGPRNSKTFVLDNAQVTPNIAIAGIYDFVAKNSAVTGANTGTQRKFRGKVSAGAQALTAGGLTIGLETFYDGIGVQGFESFGGTVSVRVPLQ